MRTTMRRTLVLTTALIGFSAMAGAAPESNSSASAPTANVQANVGSKGNVMVRTEQRLADLHTKLQITPAQEPQWQNFAQAMRDNGRKMDETFQSRVQALASMNATDNMKSYARISMQHARNVETLVPIFDALYASMSESQKHIADQVFRDDASRDEQAQRG
jgi:protein CpxP